MPTNINGILGLFNTLKLSLMFFCRKFGVKDTANNNKNTLESYKISFGVFKIFRNKSSKMKIINDTIIPVIKASGNVSLHAISISSKDAPPSSLFSQSNSPTLL